MVIRLKECLADDGETYYELNGMWYRKKNDKLESASKPKILISCKILNQDKDKEFFTKHLIKEKGQR
jgi:hypothetical protein